MVYFHLIVIIYRFISIICQYLFIFISFPCLLSFSIFIYKNKQEEIGRQMKLVLCGLYSARNVPKNLITAHSVVLVTCD